MTKHDHPTPIKPAPCEHESEPSLLKFCKQCDAVECSKCGKEWVMPCMLPHTRDLDPFRYPKPNPRPDVVWCTHLGHNTVAETPRHML